MFHKRKSYYSRGLVDFSSVFIALAWIALWFLWPSGEKLPVRVRELRIPRVSYVSFSEVEGRIYIDPTLLALPSRVGFRLPEQEEGIPDALSSFSTSSPKFLKRRKGLVEESVVGEAKSVPGNAFSQIGAYRPYWRDTHVFSKKNGQVMQLLVEPSDKLKKYGFQVPEFPIEKVEHLGKPWMVVVYIEVNKDGRPEHVFLEIGCDDSQINTMVVKTMYRGRLSIPGIKCEGRVRVNFGMQ